MCDVAVAVCRVSASPLSRHFSARCDVLPLFLCLCVFFNDPAPTEIYTLSLHDALPISAILWAHRGHRAKQQPGRARSGWVPRSEEHTSELQSHSDLVCRLLLEKKKNKCESEPDADTTTWELYVRARQPRYLTQQRGRPH